MTRLPFVAISAMLLVLAEPSRTSADHITARITSGTIHVGPGSGIAGTFEITGVEGLTFNASFDSGNSAGSCGPCQAGDTISLSSVMAPAYFGTATFRGNSYTFDFDHGGGWFSVATPSFTLPPSDSTIAEFTVPFTVTDDTFLFLQDAVDAHPLPLTGHGIATGQYNVETDTQLYTLLSIRFDFDRRPIPATR